MTPPLPTSTRVSREQMYAAACSLVQDGYQLTLLHGTLPNGTCTCLKGTSCTSPGKHPRERQWSARPIRTPSELEERWDAAGGTPNIGVMPDDTLIVIDVDCKKGKRGVETLATLQKEHGALGAPHQTTPSGGWHFVFRLPTDCEANSLPSGSDVQEGIDVLRRGRQFVAAPSQIGPRQYKGALPPRDQLPILPAQWVELLQSLNSRTARPQARTHDSTLGARLLLLRGPSVADVRKTVACVPNTPDTDRDHYVWMAHAIKGACGQEEENEGLAIFTDWAATWEGPVDSGEDHRVFTTIEWRDVRTGWPDLWRLAERHGYDASAERLAAAQGDLPPVIGEAPVSTKRTLHDALAALRQELAAIPDASVRETTKAERTAQLARALQIPFRIVADRFAAVSSPHRIRRAQIVRPGPELRDALLTEPLLALIPGYVYADMQHVLYGAPQALKTFIALDFALHVASGIPWLGRVPVAQRGAVFFAGEAASGLRIRMAAWCAAHAVSVEEAAELPFALVDSVPMLGNGEEGLAGAVERVHEASAPFRVPVGLLVIDNMTRLAAAVGLATTDTGEYGRILGGIDALGRTTGAATLTIYHSPVKDPSRPAGTYQSTANPDVIIKAERQGSGLSTVLRVAPPQGKSRGGPAPADLEIHFRKQVVTDWLASSYQKAGKPLPQLLAEALADGLTCVDKEDRSSCDAGGTSLNSSPLDELSNEARRQQFSSLVVDSGVFGAPSQSGAVRGRQAEAQREAAVLSALLSTPGISKTELRAALGGRASDIDRAVRNAIAKNLVTDTLAGRAHAYSLTNEGVSLAQAIVPEQSGDAEDGRRGSSDE